MSLATTLLYFLLLLNYSLANEENQSLTVYTATGKIRGSLVRTLNNKDVSVFWGIPYAQPPINNRRFLPPEAVNPWSGIRNASKPPKACIQFSGPATMNPDPWWRKKPKESSEDCLYMNVWVPHPKPQKAAVLIFIHGGGYYCGFSSFKRYSGEILSAEENIIVVSMNYRLWVLGFLYLEKTGASGNVGLLDQFMAIEWVHQNIESFGGDPSRITVFGHSSGSITAGFLLDNMCERSIVKRAILFSGTPLHEWGRIDPSVASETTSQLTLESQCSERNTSETLKCLQELPIKNLIEYTSKVKAFRHFLFPPVIDDKLVKRQPYFKNVEAILFGEALDDGAYHISRHAPALIERKLGLEELLEVSRRMIYYKDKEITKLINLFYTNWTDPEDLALMRKSVIQFATDSFMSCYNNKFGDLLISQEVKSYRFVFGHQPSALNWPNWFGAVHGDEIDFAFGSVLDPEKNSPEEEKLLSKHMMTWLGNFVKTGDPNNYNSKEGKNSKLTWPEYSKEKYYLKIGIKPETDTNYKLKECAFWNHVIENLKGQKTSGESCERKKN